jgi:protease IV
VNRTALSLLVLVTACGPRAQKPDPHAKPVTETLYELDLRERLPELASDLFGTHKPSRSEALGRVEELSAEPLARGLFVRLGDMAGQHGAVDEWAAALSLWREKKKPVHCHFEDLDNLGYALASHCDTLSVTPAGTLGLVGLAAQTLHGADLLARVGLDAELLQVGKYKGAAEPFTRNDMSPELRQSLSGLLDDLGASFAAHLGTRTERSPEALASLVDRGPFDAEAALASKLVDAVAFDDEARSKAKGAAGARSLVRLFPPREKPSLSLRDLLDAFGDEEPKPEARPSLAQVFLLGEIVDGEHGGPDQTAGEPFVRHMRKLADDRDVRAVVLRIDSPGGSALASDLMWHAVRRVASRKPVIVSVGDMAASGGYYVASAGTHILANRGSIVGSIGVVGGKVVARELGERIGVHASTVARGAHATWLSAASPFSDDERKLLERLLTRTYDRFLERVASGRKQSPESLARAAEGRVMGGERARTLGLVDATGGLSAAIEEARKQGRLPKDAPVQTWPDASDPLRALSAQLGVHALAGVTGERLAALAAELPRAGELGAALPSALVRKPGAALASLPFALQIR